MRPPPPTDPGPDRLLDTAPCGFLSFTDDGKIAAANTTLRNLLGRPVDEIAGRHIESLLAPGARIFYQTHFFPLLKMQGTAEEIYLSLRAGDGQDVPVLVNAARRPRGDTVYNDCILIPIHHRSRYEDEILAAKRMAEAAHREMADAKAALEQAHRALEAANVELEAQQEQLIETNAALQSQATRTALLNRIGTAIRAATAPEEIRRTAVTLLCEALGADRCYFAVYDRPRSVIRILEQWGRPDLLPLPSEILVSALDTVFDDLYPNLSAVPIGDVQAAVLSDAARALLQRNGVRAHLAAVLSSERGQAVTLGVVMAETPRAWLPDEAELVEAVAAQSRVATDAARLQQREHRIASELQSALQPGIPSEIDGLRLGLYTNAALEEASVGGDFYDIFALDGERYALVVGDVSGKGLAAAAQLATVRNMLRATLYLSDGPGAAATRLNAILADHDLLAGFVTVFVGVYHAPSGTVAYASCGHEPALIRRADSGAVEALPQTGLPLGAFERTVYEESAFQLSGGDLLMLYTDGLSEAGPSRSEMLGTSGLSRLLAGVESHDPAQAVGGLAAAVSAYALGRFQDDVCVLLAQRQDGPWPVLPRAEPRAD